MALRYRTPPTLSLQALRAASSSLRPAANPKLRTLSRVFPIERASDAPIPQAFPVYSLGLNSILDPQVGLRGAILTSWHYLIDDEVSATVMVGNDPNSHQFASFTLGRLPVTLAQRVIALNNNPRLNTRNLELSLLEVPALYVTALWLRDDDADLTNDVLLIVLSDQPALAEGRLVNAVNFIDVLVGPARSALANPNAS